MTAQFGNLGGKPPLGLKEPPPPKKPRKPIPRESKKRKAYKASAEGKAGREHMARVARLRCYVCGAVNPEVHHPKPRNDKQVIPLCGPHHRREFGPGAFHYSPRKFYELHGTRKEILKRVEEMLLWEDQDIF